MDLFRIKKEEELDQIGFWSLFEEEAFVFIEWPEMIKDNLPPLWQKLVVKMSFDKEKRMIDYEFLNPV